MSSASSGLLVNLLAFLTGAVLYAMLVALVWREGSADRAARQTTRVRLPLLTGLAGMVWNIGGLLIFGLIGFAGQPAPGWIAAVSFSALGAIPAFIVHSLFEGRERIAGHRTVAVVTGLAYAASVSAAVINFAAALRGDPVPPPAAVWILSAGFTSLTILLLVRTRGSDVGRRSVWVVALAVFAVSALHFERHGQEQAWWIELLGHHASLPLALAILHQDYRFAFADLFLKNAIAWLAMMGLSGALFLLALVPLVSWEDPSGAVDPRAVAIAVVLWATTALTFPWLRAAAGRLVDRAVLERPDYAAVVRTLVRRLDDSDSEAGVASALARALDASLGASRVEQCQDPLPMTDLRLLVTGAAAREHAPDVVALLRPDTVEPPRVAFVIGPLRDGRRLLSDDIHLLEDVTRLVARRLDALRVAGERLERSVREQQMQQLTTEAELRALRAQINPHFLFNALTTVGYLIRESPTRALETLLKLTEVLRAALRQAHVDFVTLGEEMVLVQSYLDIESARFEERLVVNVEVADDAKGQRVPSFVLQPVVENAVKHGVAPLRVGGTVTIRANRHDARLILEVSDTGLGFDPASLTASTGVGLTNVRRRLAALYGERATFSIDSAPGKGTRVRIVLPWREEAHVGR